MFSAEIHLRPSHMPLPNRSPNAPQGETAEEIAGLAKAMHGLSVPVHTSCEGGWGGAGRAAGPGRGAAGQRAGGGVNNSIHMWQRYAQQRRCQCASCGVRFWWVHELGGSLGYLVHASRGGRS